jgi:hypothetical protein
MLLFHLEDLLDQHTAGRIIVTQPSYDLRVRFNRDAFRDEILPYHVGQAFAGFVFRVTAGGEVVSGCWWKNEKASSSSELAQRTLALAGRRVKEDDAYGKG